MGGRGSAGSHAGGGISRVGLRGTERQVNYARDLRSRANEAIDRGYEEALRTMNPTPEQRRVAEESVRVARETLNQETSAGTLIDTLSGVSFGGSTESTFGEVMSALQRLRYRKRS